MFVPWWPHQAVTESPLEKEAKRLQDQADKIKGAGELLTKWLKDNDVPKKGFEKLHNIARGLNEDGKKLQDDATEKAKEARDEKEEKERLEREKKEAEEKAAKEKKEADEKKAAEDAASACPA